MYPFGAASGGRTSQLSDRLGRNLSPGTIMNEHTSTQSSTVKRRKFLQSSGAGLLLLKPETVFGYQANSAVEIGIVGCGGRGNYVGNFFVEYTGSRVVSLADPVTQPLEETARRLNVDSARRYSGLDGYRKLAESKLDAVLVTSPP